MRSLSAMLLTTVLLVGCTPEPKDAEGTLPGEQDATAAPGQVEDAGAKVTLKVGHCFVEPLKVSGRRWVTRKAYVGYGGGLPQGFSENGRFVIEDATTARFIANQGAEILFKVAPDPMPQRICQ